MRRVIAWFYVSEADLRDPSTHWAYLCICLSLVVLPAFMSCPDQAHVSFLGLSVPGFCLSREWFGTLCPGCGLTRSFVALTHGRFRESLGFHRLGFVFYLFLLWQAGYRLYCIRARCVHIPARLCRVQSVLGFGVVVGLLLNWGIGLMTGSN